MFEHKRQPLLSRVAFARRMTIGVAASFVLIAAALSFGAVGYHATEGLGWLDSFLNAAMILTGMGPVDRMKTDGGKVFAIVYAIGCGFVVLTAGALILGPVLHRLLHALHLEDSR